MPSSSSRGPKVLSKEQSDLEALFSKVIAGTAEKEDFRQFNELFQGVTKDVYLEYIKVLSPNLSDDSLHKLVAGLLLQNVTAGPNTFLRNDGIFKGLLALEASRHASTLDAILDHYNTFVSNENLVDLFNSTLSSSPEARVINIKESIKFNVLPRISDFGVVEIASMDLIEPKIKIEGGKVKIDCPPFVAKKEAAKSAEEIAKISKELAGKAIALGASPKPKKDSAIMETQGRVLQIGGDIKMAVDKMGDNLTPSQLKKQFKASIKEHKKLRKTAGIKYTLGEESATYKLLMSGNEKTIARLIDMMSHGDASRVEFTTKVPGFLENSPPELLLKMHEIAYRVKQREDKRAVGKKSHDSLNRFWNGIKKIFKHGIKDAAIQAAVAELAQLEKPSVAERLPSQHLEKSPVAERLPSQHLEKSSVAEQLPSQHKAGSLPELLAGSLPDERLPSQHIAVLPSKPSKTGRPQQLPMPVTSEVPKIEKGAAVTFHISQIATGQESVAKEPIQEEEATKQAQQKSEDGNTKIPSAEPTKENEIAKQAQQNEQGKPKQSRAEQREISRKKRGKALYNPETQGEGESEVLEKSKKGKHAGKGHRSGGKGRH